MVKRQPDPRINARDLSSLEFDGKKYVVHAHPGCPRNACIEVTPDEYLHCWACRTPLTDSAANYVRTVFQETDRGTFIQKR